MIDQLKEAVKGIDLNDLSLDIEKLIQERLESVTPQERLDTMLMIFAFLSARALSRCSQDLESPSLRAIFVLTSLPLLGDDFKERLVNVAGTLKRDLLR